MTDTATSRYGARQQSQGSNPNSWGDDKLNEVLRLMDRGSKGVQSIAVTGDQTLTWTSYVATNTGQCAVLLLTGSLSSAANLVVPSVEWQWDLIKNATGQTITVKTSAGSGVAIANGQYMSVYSDGVDCYNGSPTNLPGAVTVNGKISGVTAGVSATDATNVAQVAAAIAAATLPAVAGTLLAGINDSTANYISSKLTGAGALSFAVSGAAGTNQTYVGTVGDIALNDAGLQAASFAATAGNFYTFPTGGTVTLPAATGSRRKIGLAPFGKGISTLSGTVNGLTSAPLEGNQTVIITDSDATAGWV